MQRFIFCSIFMFITIQSIQAESFILLEGAATVIRPQNKFLSGAGFAIGFRHDFSKYFGRLRAGLSMSLANESFSYSSASLEGLRKIAFSEKFFFFSGLGISFNNAIFNNGSENVTRDSGGFTIVFSTANRFVNQGLGLIIPMGVEYKIFSNLRLYSELDFQFRFFRLKHADSSETFPAHSASWRLGLAIAM